MVSQFGSLGYTTMGKTADLTVVQKTIIDTQSLKKKMHNQPREPQPYEDCQAKSIQEFGWTSQGMDWGWGQGIKSHHTQTCQGIAIARRVIYAIQYSAMTERKSNAYKACVIVWSAV